MNSNSVKPNLRLVTFVLSIQSSWSRQFNKKKNNTEQYLLWAIRLTLSTI